MPAIITSQVRVSLSRHTGLTFPVMMLPPVGADLSIGYSRGVLNSPFFCESSPDPAASPACAL